MLVYQAVAALPDPEFPEMTLGEWIKMGFPPERRITSRDHPVLSKLRGE
jgi:hypothetical protein